jgi:hypothetical protein
MVFNDAKGGLRVTQRISGDRPTDVGQSEERSDGEKDPESHPQLLYSARSIGSLDVRWRTCFLHYRPLILEQVGDEADRATRRVPLQRYCSTESTSHS